MNYKMTAAFALGLTCVGFHAQAAKVTLVCELRGGQETPPVVTPAFGSGRFIVDTDANTVTYRIVYGGLTSAEINANIHGMVGPGFLAGVVHALPAAGFPKIGVWNYVEAQEADILAGRTYVNIHTGFNPAGEIRGQITRLVASLDSAQENPPTGVPSKGWAAFNINTCTNELNYHIVVESLSAAEIAAHIHGFSLPGTNSGVQHPLPPGPVKIGSWNYPEALEQAILDGMTYVNIHSAAFGAGEIRGQIVTSLNPIDGLQETPPIVTPAIGNGYVAINRTTDTMGYYITFAGLIGVETIAHIHGYSGPGVPSGVVNPLLLGNPKKGTWAYGAANAANVLAGLTYINIHSTAFPGGEIRGQIWAASPVCKADVNCDLTVNVTDLLAVIGGWGRCRTPPTPCPADTNNDGTINVTDLLAIIGGWGGCP